MQQITLIGNLGNDPEERTTPQGTHLLTFSLAVRAGKDTTVWYNCTIWPDRRELFKGLLPHLKKGSRVVVTGQLAEPTTYTSKAGETKISLKVYPAIINLVGGGEKKEQGSAPIAQNGSIHDPSDQELLPF